MVSLGIALAERGNRTGGDEGNGYLQQAIDAYNSTLQVAAAEMTPLQSSMVQNNLGNALRNLG